MLEYLLFDIEKAIQNEMYFIALQATLTIPDICSALASEDGRTDRYGYIQWYDKNVKKNDDHLSGEDCYYYRCSCVHQGVSRHNKMNYSRVFFIYPNSMIQTHNCVFNDALNIDIILFCRQMVSSAKEWLNDNDDNAVVKRNYEKLMKIYPNGLPPFVVGIPVIG